VNRSLAQAISLLSHPLLLPSLLFTCLLYAIPSLLPQLAEKVRWLLLQSVFIFTFAIPTLLLLLLQRIGLLHSLRMENREERPLPFVLIALLYVLVAYGAYFITERNALDKQIAIVMLSIALSLAVLTAITFFWKISAHAFGAGGMVGLLGGLAQQHEAKGALLLAVIGAVLLSGLILSARLALKAHTWQELWAGWLLGCLLNLAVLKIFF
jgi:hypothetical protein